MSEGNLSAVAAENLCNCDAVPLIDVLSNSENRMYCIVLSCAVLSTFMVLSATLICKHRRIRKLEEHIEEYFEDFRKQRNSTMKNAHYPSLSRSAHSGRGISIGRTKLNHGPSHHLYNRYSVSTKESVSPIVFDIRGKTSERTSRKTSLNILEQESTPSKEEEDGNISESYSGENKESQFLNAVPNECHKLKSTSPSPKSRASKCKFKKPKANYRARDVNVKYNELVKLPIREQGSRARWPETGHQQVPSFGSAVLDVEPPDTRSATYL